MLRFSRIAFCIGLMGLAIIGLPHNAFCIIFPPGKESGYSWLFVLADALVLLGCSLVFIRQKAFAGSLLCAFTIFLFSYIMKVIPGFEGQSFLQIINSADGWEVLGFVGGCFIMADSFKQSKILFNAGLALESIWFLWAGTGHFQFVNYVSGLVPHFIPFPNFWTYFCGVCLILTSIGLWISRLRKVTATLAVVMLLTWCLVLHIPNYFTHQTDITRLMGIFESLSFAAIMGMVRSRFRGGIF